MGLWDIDKIPYVGRQSLCHRGSIASLHMPLVDGARLIVRRINHIMVV